MALEKIKSNRSLYKDYLNVKIIEDTSVLLKNPAMGWTLYLDLFPPEYFPDAEQFWKEADKFINYFSILYLRISWSMLEPYEGCYAWEFNDNYKKLLKMAEDRGIKLAFSIYVSSMHASQQATPEYVKEAGAEGFYEFNPTLNMDCWDPYANNLVFQLKFQRFLGKFAEVYDNPDICDYIDGNSLGWWGETHHLDYFNDEQKKDVFEWIISTYVSKFKNVLLCDTYQDSSFSYALRDWAIDNMGYMRRRDSLGSPVWFPQEEKNRFEAQWPATPVFGESCYHHVASREEWWKEEGHISLYEMFAKVVADAKEIHCNTLDLRVMDDAKQWLTVAPDLVEEFMLTAGYRLVPTTIMYPPTMANGKTYTICHTWKNSGFGKLPNNIKNWNMKYRVAFALINKCKDLPESIAIADNAEPSEWIKGTEYSYKSKCCFSDVQDGIYEFAVAIIDTSKNNVPAIKLAVSSNIFANVWYKIGTIEIKK